MGRAGDGEAAARQEHVALSTWSHAIDSSFPHIAKWLFALPAFLAGAAAEELRSYVQYEFGSPNIILIRCQDFPAALSACLKFGDSFPSLPRAIEACRAASACCSYSRFNSLLFSALMSVRIRFQEGFRTGASDGGLRKSCGCRLVPGSRVGSNTYCRFRYGL
jgi:hypothetical protein